MSYKVTVAFADSLDDGFVYRTGDTYPREGYEPTPDRIIELMGTANGRGFPVIEQVAEAPAEPETEEIPFSEPPVSEEAVEEIAEEAEEAEEPAHVPAEQPKERRRTASKATKTPAKKVGSKRNATK